MDIIVSHNNTDLDGLAAMVAAKKFYPEAKLVYTGKLHSNVREFMSLHKDTLSVLLAKDIPQNKVKRIILVDTKNASRIGELKSLLNRADVEVHIMDHHPRFPDDIRGNFEMIEPVGATTTLLVERIQKEKLPLTPFEATVFALGIYEDTGCLTFATTTPRDAMAVAFLLSHGAKLSVVADFIGRPLSDNQKNLLNVLLQNAENYLVNGVKVLVATATSKQYIGGLSLLTHKLGEVANIDVIFVMVKMIDRIHMVGRSRIEAVDVKAILDPFGGGGHASAASATLRNQDINDILPRFRKVLDDKIKPVYTAVQMMSSPVKTVMVDTTIDEASKILFRYGHTGLPVLDSKMLVGIISRRDIEKAKHHGLGHAPVKGYMSRKVLNISPDTPLQEIQTLMIEHNIGRLPVIDAGRIVGIVSRTDVLRMLHGDYQTQSTRLYVPGSDENADPGEIIKRLFEQCLPLQLRELLLGIGFLADKKDIPVYLVGGFVRDLLLGVPNFDLDVVVEGDALKFASDLAEFLCGKVKFHEKFGTAMVIANGIKIDLASARTEYYEYPAALPKVETSSLKQDLYRRDFTINAMAVRLNEKNFGELMDYFSGQQDLEDGLVRILYNLSFVEDPTRILRAIRFEQRYCFQMEPQTLSLAKGAIKNEMLDKLSPDRLRVELVHMLNEAKAPAAMERMIELGAWNYIWPNVAMTSHIKKALAKVPKAVDYIIHRQGLQVEEYWLVNLIVLLSEADDATMEKTIERLRLTRFEYYTLTESVKALLSVWQMLHDDEERPLSRLDAILGSLLPEGLVAFLAMADARGFARKAKKYLQAKKKHRLQINGDDIIKMGYRPGPHFREALLALSAAKLDGLIKKRQDELDFVHKFMQAKEG